MFFKIKDTLGRHHFINSDHVVDITHGSDPDGNPRYEILLSTGHAVNIIDRDFTNLLETPDRFFGSIDQALCTINRS